MVRMLVPPLVLYTTMIDNLDYLPVEMWHGKGCAAIAAPVQGFVSKLRNWSFCRRLAFGSPKGVDYLSGPWITLGLHMDYTPPRSKLPCQDTML